MNPEVKTLKIVAALSKETLDTRDDLQLTVEQINLEAAEKNCAIRYEIIAWCEERSATGEETEWSKHFYCENPVHLIEQIRQKYQPDLILCVFWGLFGSQNFYSEAEVERQFEQTARKSKLAVSEWVKTKHPLIKIFICNRKTSFKSENEKINRFFVSNFRTALAEQQGEFWRSYERKSLDLLQK